MTAYKFRQIPINYPVLALIVANIIWGAASPIFKYSLQNIPPFSLAFYRFLLAATLLYPFVHHKIDWRLLKNKWLWAFSFSGVTINIIFFFWALTLTASINAPIIGSSGPIFILLLSAVYLRERIKFPEIVGTLIGFAGVLLIIFQPLLEKGLDQSILGNFLLIVATLGAVGSVIAGRKFLTPENAASATFWSFLIGSFTFLPFMLAEFGQDPGWMLTIDHRGWLGLLFGGFLSSAVAYTLFDWALSKMPANRTSVFTYIDPIVAIVIAVPLLGERITIPFIIGSLLVFAGILVAEGRLPYHPVHKLINKTNHQSPIPQ